MKPTIDTYPVFEANQVLTNHHLNDVFNYLDEQERLTRANLIGIGIVCGLEIKINNAGTNIHLSRGCGVTSEGYLIIEPQDVDLVSYRDPYKLPADVEYPPFLKNDGTQYPIWELFPVGEPNTTPLSTPANFLNGKVVVLFLELKKDDLANCSPNNCDDKGAEVTATVRRLLMREVDVAAIVSKANNPNNISEFDLQLNLQARLDLPDLRLPRYDVPATTPATSLEVLSAFFHVFQKSNLAENTRKALVAAYQAFRPLLIEDFPTNPFTQFNSRFGFLDSGPTTAEQVLFMQYYYDLFDDIINAYDEFRWKGVELMCACCPPEDLFPRHLFLGPKYRQAWLASGALSNCEDKIAELIVLFGRLIEMLKKFNNKPTLPAQPPKSKIDGQIRITPSLMSKVELSEKAIPYYFDHDGVPPIRNLWNPELTKAQRANQNLSYWSSHYTPVAPLFVRNPLGFDLEPFNFLRIEGHLGKNFKSALTTLLTLKKTNRLPIEIIALRTGEFDDSIAVDLKKEDCRFRDLETLYDALRDELLCSIRKAIRGFATRPFTFTAGGLTAGTTGATGNTGATLLTKALVDNESIADDFKTLFAYQVNSIGSYSENLIRTQGLEEMQAATPKPVVNATVNSIALLYRFSLLLKADLFDVDWDKFDRLYIALQKWSAEVNKLRDNTDANEEITWRELDTELMNVIFACRLEAFKSMREEYAKRVKEVKQKQYFSHFITENPGIQHKAGVPIGGTFILVYHQTDEPVTPTPGTRTPSFTNANNRVASRITSNNVDSLVETINQDVTLSGNKAVQKLVEGVVRLKQFNPNAFAFDNAIDNRVFEATIDDMDDGTIIADFFVPYICCSDCMPVQYLLPAETDDTPTDPIVSTVKFGCTNSDGFAEAVITVTGGVGPYQIQVNTGALAPLTGPITLPAGTNSIIIQDSAGTRTPATNIIVPSTLHTESLTFEDIPGGTKYNASFEIAGGTAPYTTSAGVITGTKCVLSGLASGVANTVTITDASKCTTTLTIQHTVDAGCGKPCDGLAERCRYMLWMPKPGANETYRFEIISAAGLTIVDETGKSHPINAVHQFLQEVLASSTIVNAATYDEIIIKIVTNLNEFVAKVMGPDVLMFGYDPKEPGIITIEHYLCHTFTFQIRFSVIANDVLREETWTYTEKEVTVVQTKPSKETQVLPKFGCISLDKCKGSVGNELPRSSVVIALKDGTAGSILTPTFTPAVTGQKLFWRVDGQTTFISTEPTPVLPANVGLPIHVRLEVVGGKGAWSFGDVQILKGGATRTTPSSPTTPTRPTRTPR